MKPYAVLVVQQIRGKTEYGPNCIIGTKTILGPEVCYADNLSQLRDKFLVEACRDNPELEACDVEVYFQPFKTAAELDRY